MKAALLFAAVTIGVGSVGALILLAAEVAKELWRQRAWDKHIDGALRVSR